MSYDNVAMTAVEAIKHVTDMYEIPSKYALAKALSDETLTVQPIQISNYVHADPKKRRRMSTAVAKRFHEVYGITITDSYDPGFFKREQGEEI